MICAAEGMSQSGPEGMDLPYSGMSECRRDKRAAQNQDSQES
jgi:hypothetical protein